MADAKDLVTAANDHQRRAHLSECLHAMAIEMDWDDPAQYACTCDDFSPEWTLS